MNPSVVIYASRLQCSRVLVVLHGLGHPILSFSDYLAHSADFDAATTVVSVTYGVQFTNFSQLCEQLWQILLSLGFASNLVLLGYSMGGFIAQEFAGKYTHAVAGLILVSTGCATHGTLPLTMKGRVLELLTSFRLLEVVERGKSLLPASWFLTSDEKYVMAGGSINSGLGSRGSVTAAAERNAQMHAILVYMNTSRKLSMRDAITPIQGIPTLILHGNRDSVLSLRGACNMHNVFKCSKMFIFKNAGHGFLFKHSAKVCEIVNAWLAERLAVEETNTIKASASASATSSESSKYSFAWVRPPLH